MNWLLLLHIYIGSVLAVSTVVIVIMSKNAYDDYRHKKEREKRMM